MIKLTSSQPPTSGRVEPSLSVLEAKHSRLLEIYQAKGNTSTFFDDVVDFVHEGQNAGTTLYLPEDRQTLQGMLDYWAIILHREYGGAPDTTLQEIDPSKIAFRDDQCPYKGLEPFSQSDRECFFRRDELIDEMYRTLQSSRLLVPIGPAGAGTTSAVEAGLLPRLVSEENTDENRSVRVARLCPGSNPLTNLARGVWASGAPPSSDQKAWIEDQVSRLKQGNYLPQLLKETGDEPVILFVDQFEDLFTLCLDESIRLAFADNLVAVLKTPYPKHRVILSLRLEFEDYLNSLPNLIPMIKWGMLRVKPMTEAELRAAILQPAESIGLHIQPGVVDQLIMDVLPERAPLPLLQFALLKLWELREFNWITLNSYYRLGSVKDALIQTAERLYQEGLNAQEQDVAADIFVNLAYIGEELAVTNRRLSIQELKGECRHPELIDDVIQKLADTRLVRVTSGDQAADRQAEIMHEVLVNSWPRLRGWLEESWEERRQRQRFTDKAREWDASGRKQDLLLQGTYLNDALKRNENGEHFTLLENQYLTASQNARTAAQARELRRSRQLNYTLAALLVCVAVIAILSVLYFRQLSKQANLKSLNIELTDSIEHKDYAKAVDISDELVELDLDNPQSYFKRANVYGLYAGENEQLRQNSSTNEAYAHAIKDYGVAIERKYEPLAEAYYGRGYVFLIIDQNENAIRDFSEATRIDPNYAKAHKGLGLAFVQVGEYISATVSYSEAITLDSTDVESYLARASIRIDQGLLNAALVDFTQVIAIEPNNANAFLGLARVYAAQNDQEKALANAIQAVELAPANGEITKTVVAMLDGFVQSTPKSASVWLGRARVYAALRNYAQAFFDIGNAISVKPDSLIYGQIFDLCTSILDKDSENLQARMLRASAAENLDNYEQATNDYGWAIAVDPTNAHAYFRRGHALIVRERYDSAIADFSKVIELDPNNALAYHQRGLAYAALQDYREASADFGVAIAKNPDEADAYFQQGIAFWANHEYDSAIHDFSAVIEREPGNTDAYYNRGLARMSQADYIGAIADYNQAIGINPKNRELYNEIRGSYLAALNQIAAQDLFQIVQGGLVQVKTTGALDYLNVSLAYLHLELVMAPPQDSARAVKIPPRPILPPTVAEVDTLESEIFTRLRNGQQVELSESQFTGLLNKWIQLQLGTLANNPVESTRVWFERDKVALQLTLKDYDDFTLDITGTLSTTGNRFQVAIENAAAGPLLFSQHNLLFFNPLLAYLINYWVPIMAPTGLDIKLDAGTLVVSLAQQ